MITIIIEDVKSFIRLLDHPLNRDFKLKAAGRILWWKINQLFFHLPSVVTFHNTEMKLICTPESSYGSLVVYCNLPEYREMIFLQKTLKSNSVFVDIGANVGAYTILAAAIITKGKIYSFEPMSSVLGTLYQNIRINNLEDRVKVIKKVVSDKTGYERFVSHNISEYSHISIDETSKSVLIPSTKLDDFCRGLKIPFIDAIKIDVEGAEWKVLKGFENYLKSGKVGLLIVELNKRNTLFNGDSNQVIEYLRKFKYTVYSINDKLALEKIDKVDSEQTLNIIAMR